MQANRITLTGRTRIFNNEDGLTGQQITEALRTACGHPAYAREVWIVAGNMLDRSIVENAVRNDHIDNRLWQSTATRLAECGATAYEIMAITGHRTLEEVERYTRAARQAQLADSAMAKLKK